MPDEFLSDQRSSSKATTCMEWFRLEGTSGGFQPNPRWVNSVVGWVAQDTVMPVVLCIKEIAHPFCMFCLTILTARLFFFFFFPYVDLNLPCYILSLLPCFFSKQCYWWHKKTCLTGIQSCRSVERIKCCGLQKECVKTRGMQTCLSRELELAEL